MGRNSRLRDRRRMLIQLKPPFDTTLENGSVKLWDALGRHAGPIYFELSRPTMAELRKLAHSLAFAYPDRTFRYGYDDENDAFIEVL